MQLLLLLLFALAGDLAAADLGIALPERAQSLPTVSAPLAAPPGLSLPVSASPASLAPLFGLPMEHAPWAQSAAAVRGPTENFKLLRQKVVATARRGGFLPLEELLEKSDALLLGEAHTSLSSIGTITANMWRLKKAGVTVIGVENLRKPQQRAVDDYLAGKTSKLPPKVYALSSPRRQASLQGLFYAAKLAKIKVAALDLPNAHWGRQIAALAKKWTENPRRVFSTDLSKHIHRAERRYEPGYNEAVAAVILTRRNQKMAELLLKNNPGGGKAVVLAGDGHLAHPPELDYDHFRLRGADYGSLSDELGANGLKAFSLSLTGGSYISDQDQRDILGFWLLAYGLVDAVSPEGRPVFLPTGENTAIYHMGGPTHMGRPTRPRAVLVK